jgi:hypothetical protein
VTDDEGLLKFKQSLLRQLVRSRGATLNDPPSEERDRNLAVIEHSIVHLVKRDR